MNRVAVGGLALAIAIGIAVSQGGGGGTGTALLANIFVGASGSCVRSSSPIIYDASRSCGTHQAAADASSPGDTIGVEPGTYTTVKILRTATCSGTAGSVKTWKPDNGIVRYVGTIGASTNPTAFAIGQPGPSPEAFTAPGPCDYMTFDGGPDMNFRSGLNSTGVGTGRPGHIVLAPNYDGPNYPTGITLTHWIICDRCPDTGSFANLFIPSPRHVTISYSRLGPIASGMVCNPTCESTTTEGSGSPVVVGPQGRSGQHGQYFAFVHNQVLGETHLPSQYWPTAALGPAPQPDCISCHTDCMFITVQDHFIIDYNSFYNCQTQILFFTDDNGGWDSGEVIGNFGNTPSPGQGGFSFLGRGGSMAGNYIFAFNTVNAAFGSSGNGSADAGNPTLTYIGNYGPASFSVNGGNNIGCSNWVAATPGVTVNGSYNVVTNGTDFCGATNVQTCSPQGCGNTPLDVQHLGDWSPPTPDNGVNYHLSSTATVADNVVPQATCASVISIAQSINGSYSWAQAADIDGTPMTGSFCDAGADEK